MTVSSGASRTNCRQQQQQQQTPRAGGSSARLVLQCRALRCAEAVQLLLGARPGR